MITPSLQSSRSALSPEPGTPGESEDSVRFHGRNISQLPAEVVPGITRYLSMSEVLVLGQVCRDLRSNLQVCGVITDIWNYLSLPKNKKRSVHRLVTGNRPLIDHLRNNPVRYCKSFPIQHSPAIYIKYASHFREQMIRASSVTLVSSGSIDVLKDFYSCKLNNQHNCLIQDNYDSKQLYIWTNQKNGSWQKEGKIGYKKNFFEYSQHGADILFVDGREDGKNLLSIVKRSELGIWNVTQKLYLNDIIPPPEMYRIVQMHLAENQRVMFCEVARFDFKNGEVLIFAVDAGGRWLKKGMFQLYDDEITFQFRFSQDCCHAAVFSRTIIFFVSRQDDESWMKTGEIKSEPQILLTRHKSNLEFSADDHHFVAWGEKIRVRFRNRSLRRDIQVIVASRDDHGHWSEVKRINRTCVPTSQQPSPYTKFSLDGNHLFVCINNELIILSQHEGQWLLSSNLLEPWDGSRCKIWTTMDPSLFMVGSDETAWIYGIDVSGVWNKQHEFSCLPHMFFPKISSDGDTAVCLQGEAWQIDMRSRTDRWQLVLWCRRHPDQWIKQEIDIPATWAEFSPDGSLVALASGCDLILLGLNEERQWQEKGRQQFDHRIERLCFSPCGRSVRVNIQKEECDVVAFWQVVPQEWQDDN